MKIKVFFVLVILAGTLSLPGSRHSFIGSAAADTTDINPNGSSALSLLMREMHAHAAGARADVLDGRLPVDFPSSFRSIHSAEPTSGNTKNEYYDTYADLYLMALEQYGSSNVENLESNYRNLVSACIACHTTHCPGPMVVIKKLVLEEE